MKKLLCTLILAVLANSSHAAITQLNVLSFGARGNGIADDTAAFQKAIAMVNPNGGSIYVPAGTYKITSTLVLTNSVVIYGDGSGNLEKHNGHATILQKGANVPVLFISRRHAEIRNLTVRGYRDSGDTTMGIQVGDTAEIADGGDSIIKNVTVQECGAEGIWIKNGNCCQLDVQVFRNAGHGLRLESTVAAYQNVNACIVIVKATSNGGSGLYIYRSAVNMIDAICQGNGGWGIFNNFPRNMIKAYTEGNALGSVNQGESSFGGTLVGNFVDGDPIVNNPGSFIFSNNDTNQWMRLLYNLKLIPGSTPRSIFNGAADDGTNEVQIAGKLKASDAILTLGRSTARDYLLTSGLAGIEEGGDFYSAMRFASNDADSVAYYGFFGTDPTLNALQLRIGGHPSAVGGNRFAFIEAGDSDTWRNIAICKSGGNVGIGTTNFIDRLTVNGNGAFSGSIKLGGTSNQLTDDGTRLLYNGSEVITTTNITQLNVSVLVVTNTITAKGVIYISSPSTPLAANIGAGGCQTWSSNGFFYATCTADGISATTTLIASP